ncbi:MAG TPA: tyrosine-type recombinase/integrase [Candidatus Nanoarchaeia archaeon]|nr:tyrosine-type recombinase/integrase [Candidatus Nanoarchaeia archaeon]
METYFKPKNELPKNSYVKIRKKQYIPTQRNDAMTRSEINKMFMKSQSAMIKGIMAVMLMTGSRISEVLMLRGKDITTDEEYIYFNCYILKKRNGIERIIKKIPKTHDYLKYFKEYVNSKAIKEENLVFPTSREYVWKKVKQLNPESSPHMFRHTIATYLGEKLDIFTLQKWMGWSNLNMAVKYVHPKNVIDAGSTAMGEIF